MPPTLRNVFGALAALLLAALPSSAEETVRLQGTVEKSDTHMLAIQASDGSSASIALSPKTLIVVSAPSSLAAIKPGDFVASAAAVKAGGKLYSTEVRIFPEALRGLGEGQRPMSASNTMMTNASVAEVVEAPEGRSLKVKYKGGTAELIVGPEVRVTALVVSDAQALKAGMKVTIMAAKAADGSMTANRVFANPP